MEATSVSTSEMSRIRRPFQRLEQFVREYTAGLSIRDFQRLFDRDAAHAYAVLTREHSQELEPAGLRRWLFRARLAFLGLSSKLTPARRLLFTLALIGFLAGFLQQPTVAYKSNAVRITIDFSPFWFAASLLSLIYLLALELVDRIRIRDELVVARELQADLLPNEIAAVSGYTFAHSYRTANEVGGDYYDVTPLPDGRVALMMGDASGHGMAAGLVMAIANATLKTGLDLDPSPERVVTLLNRTLCRTGTKRTFMSVFYGLLRPDLGILEYVCAGHPFPYLRRENGEIEELGRGGLPLGLRDPLPLECRKVAMHPGDLLVMYTDGLAEAVDVQGRAFSYDGIRETLRTGGLPKTVHDRILASFDRHVGEEPLRDDLTLLLMARVPAVPEPADHLSH
jgi:Stage II sporulation protein E (SpoIIE)